MARTVATVSGGARISDYISLGVIAKSFPCEKVLECLAASGVPTKRHRELPNHVVVYYVIAMALFMNASCKEVLRILLEGVWWLSNMLGKSSVTGKSGISQARSRVGAKPLVLLHDELVRPMASPGTQGAWYRGWRLVSFDGSTMDVPDTQANAEAFGRPKNGRGDGAFPQIRFVSLVECGTRILFGTRMGAFSTSELALAREVLKSARPDMLLLADRLFFGYHLWQAGLRTGAALLWRVQKRLLLPCEKRLEDGSYLSTIYTPQKERRKAGRNAVTVRVIQYALDGVPGAEESYRLVTNILDPRQAPAEELAALYTERWEIETAFDELKTHLRGQRIVLRSKQPELVRQEFYGLLMAHFAIRGLMHEAALKANVDPDRLSYVHAVRVVRRKLPNFGDIPPSGKASVS